MWLEGDPLLLVGQTFLGLGLILSAVHVLKNQQAFMRVLFGRDSDDFNTPLIVGVVFRLAAALLIISGSFAVIGIVLVIIDFGFGLVVLGMRRRVIDSDNHLNFEIFICKTIALLGICVAMLDGPYWDLLASEQNVTDKLTLSFSLHQTGTTIFGVAMILFGFALAYSKQRALNFMEKEDMPYTRLMMTLIPMLYFFFGILLVIHSMVISALIGLICIWFAMSTSIIPMWRETNEEKKAEKILHLIANFTLIGGMILLIAMHNSMR